MEKRENRFFETSPIVRGIVPSYSICFPSAASGPVLLPPGKRGSGFGARDSQWKTGVRGLLLRAQNPNPACIAAVTEIMKPQD